MEENNFKIRIPEEVVETLDKIKDKKEDLEKEALLQQKIKDEFTSLGKKGWEKHETKPGLFYFTKTGTRDIHYFDFAKKPAEYLFVPKGPDHSSGLK